MTAASTHPVAPTPKVNMPNPPGSSAPVAVGKPGLARLDQARAYLVAAAEAIDGWSARQTGEGHSYVGDGHEAIRLIDAATGELYRVRADLVQMIRADDDERAVRVDRMLAEARRAVDAKPLRDGGAA
jgi:hypothetical protein